MNIKELKQLIEKLPDETQVILAKDGEGNRFSPLASVYAGYYFPINNWSGNFISSTDEEAYQAIEVGDCDAICLCPTN